MKELILVAGFSFVMGFIGAYAFDTFLQWKDDRRWR
jgi:hypothetical protein